MSGERYLNMSCCDKVARWALLGIQGEQHSPIMLLIIPHRIFLPSSIQ